MRRALLAIVLLLVVAGCGGSGGDAGRRRGPARPGRTAPAPHLDGDDPYRPLPAGSLWQRARVLAVLTYLRA